MRDMTHEEALAFLAGGARTAKLATVRSDGSPDVVPVWFVVDGEQIAFTCQSTSVKARNLARDPRAALSVDDEAFPYAFVTVRGTVDMQVRPPGFADWCMRIASRYTDPAAGRRTAEIDDVLARLTPSSILARAEIAVA